MPERYHIGMTPPESDAVPCLDSWDEAADVIRFLYVALAEQEAPEMARGYDYQATVPNSDVVVWLKKVVCDGQHR